jgi:lysine 6-dehydrogenase
MKISVLGAGMVGSIIARDLASDPNLEVTSFDRSDEALARVAGHGIATKRLDAADLAAVAKAVAGSSVVVNAVPGFLGFNCLRTIITSGIPVVDIAFMPEDFFELEDLAREHDVPAVVDFGVAPGMSNLLVGHAVTRFQEVLKCEIVVGGLPRRRTLPWEYTAPFSPVDVLEEYTRPARLVEHGQVVERPALSELEAIELPVVGTLEAFNTDGLRTLIRTVDAPFMRERTLRYPGYVDKILLLRDSGFLSTEARLVAGQMVRPFDLTASLLFEAWKLADDEPELTVMQVAVEGLQNGQHKRLTWDLYDEYDPSTGMSSMARTTGFPAAIMARMLARNEVPLRGIIPPENIGALPDLTRHIMAELAARKVHFKEREETLLAR